ncbi:MAG: hypothetical protein AAB885_03135, partial [Patescibacteria group bacterium]
MAAFKSGEKAEVRCLASNDSQDTVKITLEVLWSEFEGAVFQSNAGGQSVVSPFAALKPKESQVIKMTLPPIPKPAFYQGALRFLDEQKNILTPLYLFRWVVEGESAKIRKIELDKDFYGKREKIQLSIVYFLSADLPNPSVKAEIRDKDRQLCGAVSKKLNPTENEAVYKISSRLKCQDPEIKAEILSGEKILDSAAKKYISASTESPKKELISNKTLLILAIVALFLLVLFLFSKYGKGKKLSDYYNYVFFAVVFLIVFNLLSQSKVFSALESYPNPPDLPLYVNWWKNQPFEITANFHERKPYIYVYNEDHQLSIVYVSADIKFDERLRNAGVSYKTAVKFVMNYKEWYTNDDRILNIETDDPELKQSLDIIFVRNNLSYFQGECAVSGNCVAMPLKDLTGNQEGFGRFTARRILQAGFNIQSQDSGGWYPTAGNTGQKSDAF